ncbi:MAG: hypothetical protein GXO81_11300 [Chlorobi bacterium]|uniref:Uncharacterized protein n=1 Tax=hydrothermal vent metagenome TaxID=652676 RepID=A0A3B0TAH1_9ZZZZ|nr:hypothetical protein [Chlorobiota bacterium]
MALLWLILGITSAIALLISYYWIKYGIPWYSLFTSLLGVFIFLFAVAWVIGAMYKGEPFAASSGMLTFGLPGILLILVGWKLSKQEKETK